MHSRSICEYLFKADDFQYLQSADQRVIPTTVKSPTLAESLPGLRSHCKISGEQRSISGIPVFHCMKYDSKYFKRLLQSSLAEGWETQVKSSGGSSRGPAFHSQHQYVSSQPSVTPVPGDLIHPRDTYDTQTYMQAKFSCT